MQDEKVSTLMYHWCSGHLSNANIKSVFHLKQIFDLCLLWHTVSKPYMLWIYLLSIHELYLWILWQLGPFPQILIGCIPKGLPNVVSNYNLKFYIQAIFKDGNLYTNYSRLLYLIISRGTTAVQGALTRDHWTGSYSPVLASWFYRL